MREEMFGPILSALSFDTEEEAIEMANNSDFGLGSGVFTSNVARALWVSDAIHSGNVRINIYRVISPIVTFGGFKNSGPVARAVSTRFTITLGPRQSGSILRANQWQVPWSCVSRSAERFSYPATKSNQQDPGYLQCRFRDETCTFSYR